MPKQSESQSDEIIAGAGPLQQRAEQNEQKNDRRRNAQGDSENAFGLHPIMPQRLARRSAFPLRHFGQKIEMAEKHIQNEKAGDEKHRQPQSAKDGDGEREKPDRGGGQIARGRQAGAIGDIVFKPEEIKARRKPRQQKRPIVNRNPIARRAFAQRISQSGERERERQMPDSDLAAVENEVNAGGVAQPKRNLRNREQLEQRPAKGDSEYKFGRADARADFVGGGDLARGFGAAPRLRKRTRIRARIRPRAGRRRRQSQPRSL